MSLTYTELKSLVRVGFSREEPGARCINVRAPGFFYEERILREVILDAKGELTSAGWSKVTELIEADFDEIWKAYELHAELNAARDEVFDAMTEEEEAEFWRSLPGSDNEPQYSAEDIMGGISLDRVEPEAIKLTYEICNYLNGILPDDSERKLTYKSPMEAVIEIRSKEIPLTADALYTLLNISASFDLSPNYDGSAVCLTLGVMYEYVKQNH